MNFHNWFEDNHSSDELFIEQITLSSNFSKNIVKEKDQNIFTNQLIQIEETQLSQVQIQQEDDENFIKVKITNKTKKFCDPFKPKILRKDKPSKPKAPRRRFENYRDFKISKKLNISSKNLDPKAASFTVKLCTIINCFSWDDLLWRRSEIVDVALEIIFGLRSINGQYEFLDPRYKDKTIIQLKDKINNKIKQLKARDFIYIDYHVKGDPKYSKRFLSEDSAFGKILKRTRSLAALSPKKGSTHTSLKEKNFQSNNFIEILDKIKTTFCKIFNVSSWKIPSSDSKNKFTKFKDYVFSHKQQKQITSDLIFTISDWGKFTLKNGKIYTYIALREITNSKGYKQYIPYGRGKDCIKLYWEIMKCVKQMTYDKTYEELQTLVKEMVLKKNKITKILGNLDYYSFKQNPSKPQKPQPIINSEFSQQEENIIKLFNRKLCMSYALLKNFIFDHNKKIFRLKDGTGQRLIIEKIEQFQYMYGNQPVIIRLDDVAYNFVV